MKVGEIEVRKRGKGGWCRARWSAEQPGMAVAEEEEYKERERPVRRQG